MIDVNSKPTQLIGHMCTQQRKVQQRCEHYGSYGMCHLNHGCKYDKEELQKWVDEHHLVTNRDKAREVFGIELNGSVCNEVMYLHEM